MKRKLLTQALQIAYNELPAHSEYSNYMHWTFVVHDGKILEWGQNVQHPPPKHFGYGPSSKLHAEMVAYRRAKGLLKGSEFAIINIRLNRLGEVKISAPCAVCWNWLQEVGCNKVVFSTPGGWARM